MRMPKVVRALLAKKWQPAIFYGVLLALFGWLLWWHLGSVPGGYSYSEMVTMFHGQQLKYIYQDPVNAPFLLPAYALLHFHVHSLVAVRLTATLFGLLTLSAFYWTVRAWHGQRAAIFGTLLFGTSAWFLHTVRLGTPDVLLFGLLGLTACGMWFKQSGKALPVILCLVLAAALLYVPGMIWFIAAGVIWQWKTIDRVFKKHLWMVTAGGVLLLAILTPLGLALSKHPQLAKQLLGIATPGGDQPDWAHSVTLLRHILDVPLQIIWRGPMWPEHWLGRLPLLDVFSMAMLFLGVYVYGKHGKLIRTQLIAVILLLGMVLAGLASGVSVSIIVPFLFVLVAAGVGLLLDRWFTVFPRNQIAQGVGLGLVSLAVLSSCWYGYRHYFVAWPAASETKSAFPVVQSAISGTIKK